MKEKTEDTSIVTQHTKGKEAMFMPKPCRSFEKKRRRLNKTFETGLTMTQETSQSLK